jgi:hypothetical protein
MQVQAWPREASLEQARADGVRVATGREELFATSDVVSAHLRLVPATSNRRWRWAGRAAGQRGQSRGADANSVTTS